MNSRQLMRWLIAKLTPMLNSVRRTTGSTQLGFLTMSSNVAFGEKNTPMIRPIGLIAGCDCASGAGRDVVVAIDVPPPQERRYRRALTPSTLHYAGTPEKFQQPSVGAQHAAPLLGTMSNPTGIALTVGWFTLSIEGHLAGAGALVSPISRWGLQAPRQATLLYKDAQADAALAPPLRAPRTGRRAWPPRAWPPVPQPADCER